jgi:hypothetical protein
MLDSTPVAFDRDELHLAQLACAKLARLVQGAVSIGLPALVTGLPEPRVFLEEQFRVMTGFALVLHTISGKPDSQHVTHRLRERSRAVLTTLDNLQHQLLEHLESSGGPSRTLQAAQDSASALCDAIGDYAEQVQLGRSPIAKVKEVVLQVFAGVGTMNRVSEPSGA